MYAVQCRVNGSIVDEERYATLQAAWDAIEGRRRLLVAAFPDFEYPTALQISQQ